MVTLREPNVGRDPEEGHRTLRSLEGRSHDGLHGLRIVDTVPISSGTIIGRTDILTIKAVKYGESPQNTEVFVGAFIPRARVPEI